MKETLFEQVPCGIFSFFDDNTILDVNQTLHSFLKLEDENIVGKNVETILTLPSRIFFQTHFFPLLKIQEHVEEIFVTLLSKNGEHFPVLLNAKRIRLNDRMLNCCACIHVPNRKKFEDDIVAARNTAEKALRENSELIKTQHQLQLYTERLEDQMRLVSKQNKELQQFSHTVTHNLKEPLRKIILYANRGLENQTSPDLQKLNRSIKEMRSVVLGLQQYVWLDDARLKIEKLDLSKIIQSAEAKLREESDEAFEIKTENLCDIYGDKDQMILLFVELLSNAVKFRKEKNAEINVTCTIIKQNKFREVEGKYSYEDFARIEVKDNGIGFDPLFKNHIFELFRKLRSTDGQGLGLSLAKKIVENHSGTIEAESEPGVYTKITFWLPYEQAQHFAK